jgi:phosphoribosylformimino-5-aminoimidazole carboxamide ribonucleotide (ProFAR) isomerase
MACAGSRRPFTSEAFVLELSTAPPSAQPRRRIVVGIDAHDGFVATEGWAETSTLPAAELETPTI